MIKLLLVVSTTLLLVTPSIAAENFSVNADLGVASDDNVNKAPDGSDDILEDTFVNGSAGVTFKQDLSFRSLVLYRASFAFESYNEFEGLDNISLTGAIDYKIQFARGFRAAAYTLTGFIQEFDFESDMRDSTVLGAQGTMAKRLTDRIATTLGLSYRARESESDVFDTRNARIFGNLDWILSDHFVTYGTLQYVAGDVVSSSRPTLDIINNADAIEPDDAFGGLETGFFAYRLDARTAVLTLGLNWGINQSNSFDTSAELTNSDAGDGIEYYRTVFRLNYLLLF